MCEHRFFPTPEERLPFASSGNNIIECVVASESPLVSRQGQTCFVCEVSDESRWRSTDGFTLQKNPSSFAYATHDLFQCCLCLFICVLYECHCGTQKSNHINAVSGCKMSDNLKHFLIYLRSQKPTVTCYTVLLYSIYSTFFHPSLLSSHDFVTFSAELVLMLRLIFVVVFVLLISLLHKLHNWILIAVCALR